MKTLVITLVAAFALAGCAASPPARPAGAPPPPAIDTVPEGELRHASDPAAILASARALMTANRNVALVTVDGAGQPRVRTVRAFLDPVDPVRPASGATVWIMTRLTTRKVGQIRAHPQVTLYFNDDERESYATIMGTAVIHTDPEHLGAKRHHDASLVEFFWPDFPRDFVMLEVRPRWLEYIGPDAENDDRTWRPQAVIFDR
jgi:general stress protein 26